MCMAWTRRAERERLKTASCMGTWAGRAARARRVSRVTSGTHTTAWSWEGTGTREHCQASLVWMAIWGVHAGQGVSMVVVGSVWRLLRACHLHAAIEAGAKVVAVPFD